MSQDRSCAVAVRLLDLGYFRIGNDVYTEEHGSFGLTTLQRQHVRKQGRTRGLLLRGEVGIEHEITIDDPETVEALEVMRRRRGPAEAKLLAWKDRARWRDSTRTTSTTTSVGDGDRGDREGLPHLARDRARGRRPR